jgi:hypothetical protein
MNMVYKTKIILNIRRLKNFPIESPGIFITHTKNLYELLFIFNPSKAILAIKKGVCQPPSVMLNSRKLWSCSL